MANNLDLSPENVKGRFHELSKESNSLLAKLNPLWEELSEITDGTGRAEKLTIAAARERETKLREQIRALQDQRAPIEAERAQLAGLLVDRTTGLASTGPLDDKLEALRDKATD